MGLIAVVAVVAGLLGATFSKILADEFKAWAPCSVRFIIKTAVARMPTDERDRYYEEWLSHSSEIPGDLGKILFSAGCLIAAVRMSNPLMLHFAAKRIYDIISAVAVLVTLFPVFAATALIIKVENRGPVLLKQTRIGKGGKPFRQFKFFIRHDILNDSRSNRFRFLTHAVRSIHRNAVDELPQIYNVLIGDMSLVGPRARSPQACALGRTQAEISNCDERLIMRPGLTGPSQIDADRSNAKHRLGKDLEYVRNFSFWNDVKIIAHTAKSEITSWWGKS